MGRVQVRFYHYGNIGGGGLKALAILKEARAIEKGASDDPMFTPPRRYIFRLEKSSPPTNYVTQNCTVNGQKTGNAEPVNPLMKGI